MIQPNPSTIIQPTSYHHLLYHCFNISTTTTTIGSTKVLPPPTLVKPNHCPQLHHLPKHFTTNTNLPHLPLIQQLSDHNGSTISTIAPPLTIHPSVQNVSHLHHLCKASPIPTGPPLQPPPRSFKLKSRHHPFPLGSCGFFMQY
ncbi:hypothetical protein O181_069321 [Austropuccinia psidii MF-1]|uniref:Uncharacterized protein n=1 Tax=Austropuccinia psidii MF-1 TaxID=1389203 RepID=A0A9Q3EWK5_9BASI|nr:hypothetical protein [Austropuccinia psidii MF-1]